MYHPAKYGVDKDPRLPYYARIKNWTAKYATTIRMYGSCGHDCTTVTVEELLRWDSCVSISGVKDYLKELYIDIGNLMMKRLILKYPVDP